MLSVFFIAKDVLGKTLREKFKSAAILTLSGVKGAVSLAAAFSLPFFYETGAPFVERPLLLFITGGAIILSLLVALITLPILADTQTGTDTNSPLRLELLEETVSQLLDQENPVEIGAVIANCQRRIRELKHSIYEREKKDELLALYRFAYAVEAAALDRLYRGKTIQPQTYLDYLDIISTMYHRNIDGILARTLSSLERIRWAVKRFIRPKRKVTRQEWIYEHRNKLRDIFAGNTDLMVSALEGARNRFPDELIDWVIDERIDLKHQVVDSAYGALDVRQQKDYDANMIKGYYVERRVIHQFLEQDKITLEQANIFRVDVNKLESFTLAHNRSEIVLKFLTLSGLR
jgi:CPA1 family monovalent cation:H+ antiporter